MKRIHQKVAEPTLDLAADYAATCGDSDTRLAFIAGVNATLAMHLISGDSGPFKTIEEVEAFLLWVDEQWNRASDQPSAATGE